MSHVVSAQPSSTSPYQPTEVQEKGDGFKPTRRSVTMETREGREDCCFRADKSQGCFLYYCCNFLSSICGAIRDCTEKCCNYCADCLNDCCEDKPQKNRKRRRAGSIDVDFNDDDNTWVVGAIHHDNVIDTSPAVINSNSELVSRSSKSSNDRNIPDRRGSHPKSIDMAYISDNQIIFGDESYDQKHSREVNRSICEPNDYGNKSGWSKDSCTVSYFSSNNPSRSHHTNVHHSGSHHTNDNYSGSHTNDNHTNSHRISDNNTSNYHTNDNYTSSHPTNNHDITSYETNDHHTTSHHTNDHHTSHDSGHHTSHDTGGNYDSGTCDTSGWDSGGGDTGGCDSGGYD